MAMAVAIDTSRLALDFIPRWQRNLDELVGGDGRRFQIYRASVYGTILSSDSGIYRQLHSENSSLRYTTNEDCQRACEINNAKEEALNWQADPDDDLGDEAVFRHLHQQAATVPLLATVISRSDRDNVASTLTGSALAASINATTRRRLLSSFHRYSCRISEFSPGVPIFGIASVSRETHMSKLFPCGVRSDVPRMLSDPSRLIIWAGPKTDNYVVFWQMQVDVVDLFGRRFPTSRPRKRRRTAFNQFGQLPQSPVGKRFNGVRHRTDRNIWVAEMKPPKHKTKQDFGNFNSEVEAARAVDAAYHHYGRPELLNFPHTSLQFLSTRPSAPEGLDEKAKVKFVREEARLLLVATAASSPLHSTHATSTSLQIPESPRCCSPGPFRSFSEISSPLRCSGPDEVHAVVLESQPQILHGSISKISTIGDLETVNLVGSAEQEWDWAEDPCTLAVPPNVVNPSTSESPNMCLDSILRWSPAPTYPRSPSPSHFQDEIVLALLEHQSI